MRWRAVVVVALLAALLDLGCSAKGQRKHRRNKPDRRLMERMMMAEAGAEAMTEAGVEAGAEALYPEPVDAALTAVAAASATCGDGGPEDFCREMPGKRGVACGVCEGAGGGAARRHPPAHALDADAATWWQSPTLARGDHYESVDFTVTLQDEMELMYVIVKAGPSPRPAAWALEVSTARDPEDEGGWRVLRAFGDRERCERLWGLRPERPARAAGRRGARRPRRRRRGIGGARCSTQFASPKPLENGEMHVAAGGARARHVRLALRALHAGAPERRYYSVRALTLAARCLCHGHADICAIVDGHTTCACQHGACGDDCGRCCGGGAWAAGRTCAEPACACGGRALACAVDPLTAATICLNCTENRAGVTCEECLPGHYRPTTELTTPYDTAAPATATPYDPAGPCLPCDCHPEGSTGECSWDAEEGVQCACREGYAGPRCSACAAGHAGWPQCARCRCDPRGLADPADPCQEPCRCKVHVQGETCGECAAGYYGLSASLAEGCRECYCSGVSTECAVSPNVSESVSFSGAWYVTDLTASERIKPALSEQGRPVVTSYELDELESYYWLAPEEFLGDRTASYGASVEFRTAWSVMRGDTGGAATRGPDVVLLGADGARLAYGDREHGASEHAASVSAPLVESGWYHLADGVRDITRRRRTKYRGYDVSRARFMAALASVRGILLRAKFHTDQADVRLEEAAVRGGARGAELCACPAGYAGASCQRCAWGHRSVEREASAAEAPGRRFECVRCECNGHAASCGADGQCGACEHRTTGARCERCLPGHYGNPLVGTAGDCRPCACPLLVPSNNFSPNCALADAGGDDYVCTQCPEGYTGDHCEQCDYGWWGSPETVGGACAQCACGGAPCDPHTGECLLCPANTDGYRCEYCKENHWRGAAERRPGGGCVPCACGEGALSAACDAESGRCVCGARWRGRACDECAAGYGGAVAGCPPCRCGAPAAASPTCDAVTGACECRGGVAPPLCDVCLPDHYGYDATGCTRCNCSREGAEGGSCDIRTGQCRCRPHVTGVACDTCQEGYWGVSVEGCRACECDGAGALATCDPHTGACACKPGVGGARCDSCLPGYYGFSHSGCLPCPDCGEGKVCDATSGRCTCPPLAAGATCRECRAGAWGLRAGVGCQPCACAEPGSTHAACDPLTGQCTCRAGWTGRACERCARGHYGARCRPCACHAAGARCDALTGLCPCDESGQCECKENVEGVKCDACRNGTFGLSALAPDGCTACYCFGRSSHCSQAGLTRTELRAPLSRRLLVRSRSAFSTEDGSTSLELSPEDDVPTLWSSDGITALPGAAGNVTLRAPAHAPLYWQLDARFAGDRVTSYGGFLRFTTSERGGEELPPQQLAAHPLVQIRAYDTLVLDYYQIVPPVNGTHSVRFHESLWRVRGRGGGGGGGGGVATRAALMIALRGLQRVFVRATTRRDVEMAELHKVSLDTTVATEGAAHQPPASGVELCACPRQYGSTSCQQPAPGWWLPAARVRTDLVSGTVLILLEEEAAPCHCNRRADTCDPRTGHCTNCTGHTAGASCERCAEGYFGRPESPLGCQPCPCPERSHNFASTCTVRADRVVCLCKPGYAGADCSECAEGWWRSGRASGECSPCACSGGALGADCRSDTGQCRCRDNTAGRRCHLCRAPKHYLEGSTCTACDNCTDTLLRSMEVLSSDMRKQVDMTKLNVLPSPYPLLQEYSEKLKKFKHRVQAVNTLRSLPKEAYVDLVSDAEYLLSNINSVKASARNDADAALSQKLESESLLEKLYELRRRLQDKVEELEDFSRNDRHVNIHKAVKEARHILKKIGSLDIMDQISNANKIFDAANVQSTLVNEYSYRLDDSLNKISDFDFRLDVWHNKTDDLIRLNDRVWDSIDVVAAVGKRARDSVQRVSDVALRSQLIYEDIRNVSGQNRVEQAAKAIEQYVKLVNRFPAVKAELNVLMMGAEEKEGIMYNLNPAYKDKFVEAAEKHMQNLTTIAEDYKGLFSPARGGAASAVGAVRAWDDIAGAVRAASAAADAAADAVRRAHRLADDGETLPQRARDALDASRQQSARAQAHLHALTNVSSELDRSRQKAERIGVQLRGIGWKEKEVSAEAAALGGGAGGGERLAAANEAAARVSANMRVLYKEAGDVAYDARYKLRRRLQELQGHGDDVVGGAEEHVAQSRGNILRASTLASGLAGAARARAQEAASANDTLARALRQLRDAIASAKHAAHQIQVSLRSPADGGAGCVRSYRAPQLAASATTRISLALSLGSRDLRDAILLYVGGAPGGDYLRLELAERRLRLEWSLRGAAAAVTHPEILQPLADQDDHSWYQVEVLRLWNTGRLSVEKVSGLSAGGARAAALAVSNTTGAGGEGVLSAGAGLLWLGGAGAGAAAAGDGVAGCVHAVAVDGQRLGLWDFVTQPPGARCVGCTERWQRTRSSEEIAMYHFSGNGYSVMRRVDNQPYNRNQFSVSLAFRTFDEDAMLFMAVDAANERWVQVSLRGGRVVFRVHYAEHADLEIVAAGRHCHGRLVHVQAARVFAKKKLEKGSLRVNGEETLGSPNPPVLSADALPELTDADYWVGGAPPAGAKGAGGAGAGATPPPLLGCLGDLTVEGEGYDPLDTSQHYGVEAECGGRLISTVGFRGDGYAELASRSLRRRTQLGLAFRTRQASALLLLATPRRYHADLTNEVVPEDSLPPPTSSAAAADDGTAAPPPPDGYYSLSLLEGNLVLIMNAGKGNLRLSSNDSLLHDGRFHSVRVRKAGRKVELWLDDRQVAGGALAGGSTLRLEEPRGTYLGGLPPRLQRADVTDQRVASAAPLVGALKDLIFDGSIISLDTVVALSHAQIGRLGPAMGEDDDVGANQLSSEEPKTDATETLQGCHKVASYTVEPGAVKFGDAPHSYAAVRAPGRGAWTRNLTLQLHFRTFYPDGLIFIAPGSKPKQRHLVALFLRDGRVTLLVRARRKKELSLPAAANDGEWRHVVVRATRTRLSLVMGTRVAVTRMPRKLSLASMLYVGGLPERASMPNVPESIWKVSTLKGCVRRLMVNGRAEDLVKDAALHHNVGQCFPAVERGAHFSGDAYGVWSQQFSVGSHVELRLEFRTSEQSGVLLSTAAPHAALMSLELRDGEVVMSVRRGDRRALRVSARAAGAGAGAWGLCDDAWHSVEALYSAEGLSLRLDAQPERVDVATDPPPVAAAAAGDDLRPAPLYIGGLPEGAHSGLLTSKDNFKGCIRNISIQGDRKDWTDMDSLHHVLLSSCPVSQ